MGHGTLEKYQIYSISERHYISNKLPGYLIEVFFFLFSLILKLHLVYSNLETRLLFAFLSFDVSRGREKPGTLFSHYVRPKLHMSSLH